jgi:hypothetical protein
VVEITEKNALKYEKCYDDGYPPISKLGSPRSAHCCTVFASIAKSPAATVFQSIGYFFR